MATTRSAGLPLHFEHLPERFGLLVILVLGESIAAIAVGVHETHWEPVTVTVAALGFVVAVSLWWTYFDLAGAAATHTLADRGGHRSTLLHDIYAYGHWPIALGLAAAGVGIEDGILEGGQASLASGTRWVLCGGVALYLLALTAIQGGIAGSLRSCLVALVARLARGLIAHICLATAGARGGWQPRARDAGRRGLGQPARRDGPDRSGPYPRLPPSGVASGPDS